MMIVVLVNSFFRVRQSVSLLLDIATNYLEFIALCDNYALRASIEIVVGGSVHHTELFDIQHAVDTPLAFLH